MRWSTLQKIMQQPAVKYSGFLYPALGWVVITFNENDWRLHLAYWSLLFLSISVLLFYFYAPWEFRRFKNLEEYVLCEMEAYERQLNEKLKEDEEFQIEGEALNKNARKYYYNKINAVKNWKNILITISVSIGTSGLACYCIANIMFVLLKTKYLLFTLLTD